MRLRLAEVETRVTESRRTMNAATEERDRAAADLGIAEWIDKLTDLIEAVHSYSQTLAEWWPAIRARADARLQAEAAEERVSGASCTLTLRNTQLHEAKGKAAAALER